MAEDGDGLGPGSPRDGYIKMPCNDRSPLALLAALGWISATRALREGFYGDYPDLCPRACSAVGSNPAKWSQYHRLSDLEFCDEPMLFDLNVQNLVTDPKTVNSRDVVSTGNNCGATVKQVGFTARASSASFVASTADLSAAANTLVAYLQDSAACGSTIMFAKSRDAVVGVYAGAEIQKAAAAGLVRKFLDQAKTGSASLQICTANSTDDATFGPYAGSMGDLGKVQDAVKTWTNGQCLDDQGSTQLSQGRMDAFPTAAPTL
ncbi:class V chitinase [Diplogelasinospora grovesii]|uniref:Class V chitinase n=1 Tax=Diplogelasinospora grovesii TaxID=303347 RepID=A0AAN6NC36_9PEZI|nr:class V chitinase [Diplogelasinospora grovesii]